MRVRNLKTILPFCLVAACGGDIGTGIESANDLLYSEQYVESERLYRKLLRRLESEAPHLTEAEETQRLLVLDRLGKLNALYLHDYDQAIRYYKQLVMLYPRSSQAFAGLATIADILQHKLGKHEAAIEAYQKMVSDFQPTGEPGSQERELRDQEQTRAQLRIANAYFALKNYQQARSEAEKLINRWPESGEASQARFQIANSYYLEARYAEAVATYERLLENEVDPDLASLVLFELGNCFQELGENKKALAYYYGCLADHPDPLLVQRKIKRLRKRIGSARPADSIHIPGYLKSRLDAVRALPFGVTTTTTNDKPTAVRTVTPAPSAVEPATPVVEKTLDAKSTPPANPKPLTKPAVPTSSEPKNGAPPAGQTETEQELDPARAAPPTPKPAAPSVPEKKEDALDDVQTAAPKEEPLQEEPPP